MKDIPLETWTLIDGVFARALELDERERPAFLDEACGHDAHLRRVVDELLAAESAAATVLGEHASDFAGGLIDDFGEELAAEPAEDLAPGARIGPYRVVRELGGGGMGRVYLAERADEHFEKRVALKLVRRGMDTDEVLRRFRLERQILASLEHPGIARLLDGGVAPDGRPFLVMDHVEGRTLDRWLEQERPDVRERLRLFVRICDAVQHAHRRLVVHRDLKPSNVLVTSAGDPRLLDFGIAKLLSPDDEAFRTRTGVRIVTPELAAPEQLRGEDSGTAADVHGLGVLLYFLLAERNPWAGARRSADPEASAPAPPSTASPNDSFRRQVRGDLDLITMRALHPDPDRRYGSASDLGWDVRRHLDGRPVEARPDSPGYRLRKFAGRNRRGLAVGMAVVLVLGVLGSAVVRERVERSREARASLAVSAFLESLLQASDPMASGGERLDTLPAIALLDRGLERIEDELGDSPRAQGRLLHTLGIVYMNSGAAERGESLLRQAVDVRRGNGEPASALGSSLLHLGRASLERGRAGEAEAPLREALSLGDALDPLDRAAVFVNLAVVHQERGELEAADSLYRYALERFRARSGTEPRQATVLSNRALLAMRRGDFDSALPLARQALDLQRAHLPEGHPALSRGINNLAVTLRRTGDTAGAEQLYREALESFRGSLASPHPMLAIAQLNLAITLVILERVDEAEPLMLAAVEDARGGFSPDHPDRASILLRVASFFAHDVTDRPRGSGSDVDLARAEPLAREALEIFTGALGPRHSRTGDAHGLLGEILLRTGRPGDAEPHLLSSWSIVDEASDASPQARRRAAVGLIELYEGWGLPERAEPFRSVAEEDSAPR